MPLSPERKKTTTEEPRSPGRILLGIDKGLSGRNVSLKRAPSLRTRTDEDPFYNTSRRSESAIARSVSTGRQHGLQPLQPLQRSFNQRMAESRQQAEDDRQQKLRADRLRRQKSTGFGVQRDELETLRAETEEAQPLPQSTKERTTNSDSTFSRAEVMEAFYKPVGGLVQRSNTISGVRNTRCQESSSTLMGKVFTRPRSAGSTQAFNSGDQSRQHPSPSSSNGHVQPRLSTPSTDSDLFEPFSSIKLSRRILPHSFMTRTLASKKVVLLPALLRDVRAPSFTLPSTLEESDIVVMAVIASKSAPLSHKDAHKPSTADGSTASSMTEAAASESNVRGKYMVLTLTDFTWTLDLYLFTTAYTRFWKLTPGTVVAILNPSIMPPPRGKTDTGRWSLVLSSSDDTILEVGTAQDLGFCKAIKRDGKKCDSWVNSTKTEFCEWHVDRGVEKVRRGRMELQGMSVPFAPGGRKGGRYGVSGARKGKPEDETGSGLLREGKQYDRAAQSVYFIGPRFGSGASAAALIDAETEGFSRLGDKERLRKRLAEREKERQIARRLGEAGSGAGAEYLRSSNGDSSKSNTEQTSNKDEFGNWESLGLFGNKAQNVQLSPLKRKNLDGERGGTRKKTRFVTAKGIREAGRESFGVMVEDNGGDGAGAAGAQEEGDEDELDIV